MQLRGLACRGMRSDIGAVDAGGEAGEKGR
jgi:hypothetical protein